MLIEVAAAIICKEGQYLIAKRKQDAQFGNSWEFPGGKRNPRESLEDCLRREIKEEIGVEITIHELAHEALYPYSHSTVLLYFYHCSIQGGELKPLGCQELRWVSPQELPTYSFPPANNGIITELMGT